MIFQWYLFVLIAFVAIATNWLGSMRMVKSYGKTEYRYTWVPVLIIMIPLIYLAGTRGDMGFGDTSAYRISFRNMPATLVELPNYLTDDMKDRGFAVLSVFIKSIIGNRDVVYFTIIAAVCLICVICTYKKYSCNFAISIFLFLASGDYIQWNYNGIRQFIPVAILFACAGLILRKKYIALIIIILALSTIHATALLMLPMIFMLRGKAFNIKTISLVVLVLVAITSLDSFTNLVTTFMENTQYQGEVNQYLGTDGTNWLRVLVFAIPTVLALVFYRKIREENNKLIDLCINMSIVSTAAYVLSAFTSGIFIGRIPIYFSLYNYILIPWIFERFFTKRTRKMLYAVLIVCYLVFYYYQVSVTWNL